MTFGDGAQAAAAAKAAHLRASFFGTLAATLPPALLARVKEGTADGSIAATFRQGAERARAEGVSDPEQLTAYAVAWVLYEQAVEIGALLEQQEQQARELARYHEGRRDALESSADRDRPAG